MFSEMICGRSLRIVARIHGRPQGRQALVSDDDVIHPTVLCGQFGLLSQAAEDSRAPTFGTEERTTPNEELAGVASFLACTWKSISLIRMGRFSARLRVQRPGISIEDAIRE